MTSEPNSGSGGAERVTAVEALECVAAGCSATSFAYKQLVRYIEQSEHEMAELQEQLEQVCDVLYNTGATRGDALTRAERALESYRQHIDDEIGREEDLAEALGRMQMNGDTGQYEATDSFDAMCAEVAKIRKERDSLRAQLTEAQQQNEVLRAERDRLREELTRFLQWECGELAMSERLPKQSPTSDSPAKEEWKWCPDCEGTERHGDPKRCDNSWHNLPDSPAKLGGAVSREELVEALRLPGAHGPVEYALNRVATALERGGKADG